MRVKLDRNKINPNGWWLLHAMKTPSIRYILMQGGSSSSKSYSFAQICLFATMIDHENTLVLRKIGASISRTIYEDFKVNASQINQEHGEQVFKCTMNRITCLLGGKIDFTGLDDSEKIKGISNYKRIFMDELTEFEEGDWRQIRTRMRGKEGQQLFAAFNPIAESHWIKRSVYDNEKWVEQPKVIRSLGGDIPEELTDISAVLMNEPQPLVNPRTGEVETIPSNFLWLKSTYLNNFWVVGSPDGTYGYYDRQCIANYEHDKEYDPDYYMVYALGEWGVIRTGGEFLPSFSMKKVMSVPYIPELPVHVSVDNNVLPYITTTMWQYDIEKKEIRQFAELCAEDPNNTVSRAGEMVAEYLSSLGVTKVYLHGDVTTKAASTIDDEKRSFFDKYMEKLERFDVEDCTPNSNPSVRTSGEFLNALLDGWGGFTLMFDESCKHSAEDYLSVKKDVNGGILKVRIKDTVTKQSYEQYGHCTDTARYIICDVLKKEYTDYSLRRKHNTHTELNYIKDYVPGKKFTFIVPSFDEKAAVAVVAVVGERFVLEKAIIRDAMTSDEIISLVEGTPVYESEKPFFDLGRRIRERYPELTIRLPKEDPDERIKATSPLMENLFFLESTDDDYNAFLDNLQDYNGKESRHASNIIALALLYLSRH